VTADHLIGVSAALRKTSVARAAETPVAPADAVVERFDPVEDRARRRVRRRRSRRQRFASAHDAFPLNRSPVPMRLSASQDYKRDVIARHGAAYKVSHDLAGDDVRRPEGDGCSQALEAGVE